MKHTMTVTTLAGKSRKLTISDADVEVLTLFHSTVRHISKERSWLAPLTLEGCYCQASAENQSYKYIAQAFLPTNVKDVSCACTLRLALKPKSFKPSHIEVECQLEHPSFGYSDHVTIDKYPLSELSDPQALALKIHKSIARKGRGAA